MGDPQRTGEQSKKLEKEITMWSYLILAGLLMSPFFIGGFKSGWHGESVARSARALFLSKLRSCDKPVSPREESLGLGAVEHVIEGRLTTTGEGRGLIGRRVE